jgi:hypothetical protein
MIFTTLNRIREHAPCREGWEKLLRHLGKTKADNEPVAFATIVESNGLEDALWCCRAEPQHAKEWRIFSVRCARRVQHLMTDPRSISAVDVAERHASGLATEKEMVAAWVTAKAAARAAALENAGPAAKAAACAADASAWDTTRAPSRIAARDGSMEEITEDFLVIVGENT